MEKPVEPRHRRAGIQPGRGKPTGQQGFDWLGTTFTWTVRALRRVCRSTYEASALVAALSISLSHFAGGDASVRSTVRDAVNRVYTRTLPTLGSMAR